MITPTARLLALLDLETLDDNLFRSARQEEGWKRVYGGQVLGQALVAAERTVEPDRPVHSLHAYFILPGDPAHPILYQTERARDGKSFATRRVVAIQHGRPIFNLAASFQVREPGFEHQADAPAAPPPEGLASDVELLRAMSGAMSEPLRAHWLRPRAIDVRPVDGVHPFTPGPRAPSRAVWLRVTEPLPHAPALHRAILAYASDNMLVGTAMLPHRLNILDPDFQLASLDHAMWYHADFRADEWLLYTMESPRSGGARGLVFGRFHTRAGVLVASVAQEGLMRQRG